jgi:hypothetical protein
LGISKIGLALLDTSEMGLAPLDTSEMGVYWIYQRWVSTGYIRD